MAEIQQLTQLGGTVVTVLSFLLYLQKKDKLNKETYDDFNKTISNHLDHSTQIIKENSESNKILSLRLQELTDIIKTFKKSKGR